MPVLIVLFVLPIDIHYEEAPLQMYHFLFSPNIPTPFLYSQTVVVFSTPVYTTIRNISIMDFKNTLLQFIFRITVERQFAYIFWGRIITTTNTIIQNIVTSFWLFDKLVNSLLYIIL